MLFRDTSLAGVLLIEPDRNVDERGFFARTWCQREFSEHGLSARLAQCGTSFSERQGTLRGMHYQIAPHAEEKLVRCTQGAVFDVVVDLRPGSATRYQWFGVELTARNRLMLYVPAGCAHGLLTLADHTEVFYQLSASHHPASARGVRWNDPRLAIRWPGDGARIVSDRDRNWPLLPPADAEHTAPRGAVEAPA